MRAGSGPETGSVASGVGEIRAEGLRWAPPESPAILEDFSIRLPRGRITALVGPSGCGKSSLLRLIAGLRAPDAGEVVGVPGRRAFVFQDAALLPWLDVRANVALPGRFGPIGDVDAALTRVGLGGLGGRLPRALSGGQRMRVSLARALVSQPEIVLLDEAFAALDGVTRRALQRDFLSLQAEASWTVVMVTHELVDAVWLSDRVVALAGPPLTVRGSLDVPLPRPRDPDDPAVAPLVKTLAGWF